MVDQFSSKPHLVPLVDFVNRLRDRYPNGYVPDREVVQTAVAQTGEALEYASEKLRADREVVLTAVSQTGKL